MGDVNQTENMDNSFSRFWNDLDLIMITHVVFPLQIKVYTVAEIERYWEEYNKRWSELMSARGGSICTLLLLFPTQIFIFS
jgi:hypothetical protein